MVTKEQDLRVTSLQAFLLLSGYHGDGRGDYFLASLEWDSTRLEYVQLSEKKHTC